MERSELEARFREFASYMTYGRCANLGATEDDGSILRDDVMKSVGAFIEFCCTGKVTDELGEELRA